MLVGRIERGGSDRLKVDFVDLHGGDAIKVLVVDKQSKRPKWISTTVERDGHGYYLEGLTDYNPIGLFAKVTAGGLHARIKTSLPSSERKARDKATRALLEHK